jgi:integrase
VPAAPQAGTPAGDKPSKPEKPTTDFPLFAHAAGVWAKKIRGKLHYFGPWDDPEGALKKYNGQAEALHAGRTPKPDPGEGCTIKALCNEFLGAKEDAVNSGELSPRTWRAYKSACDLLVAHFGKGRLVEDLGPKDFAGLRNKMAERWGVVYLGVVVQEVRSVFKYAFDAELIDRPVRTGPGFKAPARKVLRLHKAARGPRLFTADEIHRMLAAAGVQMKAMILLGINCGFGNADCGKLPLSALDLEKGVIDYPRPKTGIPRRCALWPETVRAIREALARRPEPRDPGDAGLVFITRYGRSWVCADGHPYANVKQVGRLLRKLGINGRHRLGFYTLRHTFRTVADEAKDQPAADFIMGHEVPHMSAVYRETISDARLRAVAEHVRAWLWPSPGKGPEETETPA